MFHQLINLVLFDNIYNFVSIFISFFMDTAILEVNDYYAVTLGDSQIMGNIDIYIVFSSQYNFMDQVYVFTLLQIKYNKKAFLQFNFICC